PSGRTSQYARPGDVPRTGLLRDLRPDGAAARVSSSWPVRTGGHDMTNTGSEQMKSAHVTGRGIVVVLVVLAIAATLPRGLPNYQVGLATETLILGMLAMSLDIPAGFPGRPSLGHAAIFGVSGYVVVYTSAQAGLPPAVAFVLGMVAATMVAIIFALLAVRT